ncbi:hypothetical protein [Reichenbachiella versicolor]|uniref:hypothetical protein n=1 Tax=Reichenbachiella versicolor TaxID=1821036 RepID=UPI001C877D62|nr:hypothetical protein [Reichenbachiella versicolor]
MSKSILTVNVEFIKRLFSLSDLEIQSNIYSSLKSVEEQEWRVSSRISIHYPIRIVVNSLPKKYRKSVCSKTQSNKEEFFQEPEDLASYKELDLRLRLRSKFLENPDINFTTELYEYCISEEDRMALYKKIEVFDYCISISSTDRVTSKELWRALMSIGLDYYKNECSFTRKLKEFRSNGPSVFLHAGRGASKPWKRKLTPAHTAKILDLYNQNFDSLQITEKLKSYCEEFNLAYISRSTVKSIIGHPRNKVICGLGRNGSAYVKNKVISFIEKKKPEYKLQVVECDGSRLQLPYQRTDESKWKIGYLTLYIIMDVASNKVIGYWVDDFENKDMVFMAFYMMLSTFRYLPAFIRIDRSSTHQSDRFNIFLERAKEYGMSHRICYEPREKGTVESFFHWFPEKVCKKYPTYTGLGPLIHSWDKKPSPEQIDKIEKSKTLPSRSDLTFFIPQLIDQWNQRRNSTNSMSPDTIHEQLKYDAAKHITKEIIAQFTWKHKTRKSFTRNTIRIGSGDNIRSYRLESKEAIMNCFEQPLNIYYLDSEPEHIFVFNEKGDFVEEAYKKTKYLDDPIRISDPENQAMLKESNENYDLIREIKKEIKQNNSLILRKKKDKIPFSITTGYLADKELQNNVVDEFLLEHSEPNTSNSTTKDKFNTDSSELDKNITSTKIKRRYKHKKQNIIRDVE